MAAERFFKLNALDWLNDGNIKLFRSPSEGNYLMRLVIVSLSPYDTVGRILHPFNCTAYEVADYKKSYLNSNFISLLSERDYSNRKNELEELVNQSEIMLKKYNKFLSERFGPNFNQNDFQEQQFENHEQRMMYQKKKLQDQDDMIDSMIAINNENKQISKEMGNNIGKQNSLLDRVQRDIDNLDDKMNKSNLKVTNFLAKSSYCKLYIIAIVQALIILFLIL